VNSPTSRGCSTDLFAFAAKGFSPGTANGSGAILSPAFVANPGDNPALNQVEPETVISHETGWRSTLANGALRTQMGVFLSDYTNFQITNRNLKTGQTGALVNADSATLYGFEAQAQLAAAGFQADVSLAAMKSRIDNASVVDKAPRSCRPGRRRCRNACRPPDRRGLQGLADAGTTRY
jgi:iron complex outermembrane receptor protein